MMHHDEGLGFTTVAAVAVSAVAVAYVALARRQRGRGRKWSPWRTAAFVAGSGLLVAGLFPRLLPFAEGDFRNHMMQHLLIGMLAPLGLVMAGPVSLVMGSVPTRYGRAIAQVLRSRALHIVAHPATALLLNIGGMAALYFTPLYSVTMNDPAVFALVHLHFLAAGCLYTWVIAGPDPAPGRPSVPTRLVVLGIAITLHSVMAQMIFAGAFGAIPATGAQLEGGAELMYYGGDIAEILLAFALVTTWRPEGRRVRRASAADARS